MKFYISHNFICLIVIIYILCGFWQTRLHAFNKLRVQQLNNMSASLNRVHKNSVNFANNFHAIYFKSVM